LGSRPAGWEPLFYQIHTVCISSLTIRNIALQHFNEM